MPELDPSLRNLHFVLRTLAVLTALAVVFYIIVQSRVPEAQRPSGPVRVWITASTITMFVIAVGLALISFTH